MGALVGHGDGHVVVVFRYGAYRGGADLDHSLGFHPLPGLGGVSHNVYQGLLYETHIPSA